MLMMKCSQCEQYIKSELLVELKTIKCEYCETEVAVKNVLVSSNGFTFDRDDLLKRFFRYRKLLDEVIDERNAMDANRSASDESKRSIEQFLTILQGMMTGARDNFRYQFEAAVMADLNYSRHHCHGRFINLSMEGACLSLDATNPLPRVGTVLTMAFSLPDQDTRFNPRCTICWVEQGKASAGAKHVIGVKFSVIADEEKNLLWNFIADHASR